MIFSHICPDAIFENDIILPICKITDNNVKVLINANKSNGFKGLAFIPNEVRIFLQKKMPTQYNASGTNPDTNTDAMVQSHTHYVPNSSIPPKHSPKHITTSDVSQKTSVVKLKKLSRSDVSGRQSGSKDFSLKPLTQMKLQGGVQVVLVLEKETKEDG